MGLRVWSYRDKELGVESNRNNVEESLKGENFFYR